MLLNRYQCGVWLSKTIGWDQFQYMPEDCRKLIYDWKVLDDLIESNVAEISFSDYSFSLAPMYKAVEGILWKIAVDLGIEKPDGILGNFFDEDYLDKFHPKIDKSGLAQAKIREIKHELSELKTFLKRYRHNPAHYGTTFDSVLEARLASSSALHNIKCLIKDLLLSGLIIAPQKPTQSEEIQPDDIPF